LKENTKPQNVVSVFHKINRNDNSKSLSFAQRNEGSCVCVGSNDWISKYANATYGAHHVLSCESIMDTMAMSVPSWISSDKPGKRAGFLWASMNCGEKKSADGQWKNEIRRLNEVLGALVNRSPFNTPILVVFQRNYKKALSLSQQRKAALNVKSTCGWSAAQDNVWRQYLEDCRWCEALWIGSSVNSNGAPA